MNQTIADAVRSRSRLKVYYDGGYRIIEPHCYGYARLGRDLLRAFQVSGYSKSGHPAGWKLFLVAKMSNISVLDDTFSENRPDYVRGDSAMARIYAEV